MRRIELFFGLVALTLSCLCPSATAAPVPCTGIGIRAAAEVGDSGVSLADLLTMDSCPALRHAAASVWLGNSPQPGSARVFEGSEIRRALNQLTLAAPVVPERIVVHRSGAKDSCDEITDFISRTLRTRIPVDAPAGHESARSQNLPRELDCGRDGRVPQDAPLELTRVFWDPALQGWEYSLRCIHARDCVPFLVKQITVRQISATWGASLPGPSYPGPSYLGPNYLGPSYMGPSYVGPSYQKDKPQSTPAPLAIQVGQTATLFWEQDGIRAVLPVTCLDRGSVGSLVRARTKNGNRILRAEVVSPGVLRAAL